MTFLNIIYLIIWVAISIVISLFLYNKSTFFKKVFGFIVLIGTGALASVFHNMLYALNTVNPHPIVEVWEIIFFFVGIILIGAGFFHFWIWLFYKIFKRRK